MRVFLIVGAILCLTTSPGLPRQAAEGTVRIGQISFDAHSTSNGSVIRTRVRITNHGRDSTQVLVSAGCEVATQVYRQVAGIPAWDDRKRICFAMEKRVVLLPNKPVEFEHTDSIARIRGDSLAPGTYRLAAVVNVVGARLEIPTGSAVLR